jgi:hypothetical protein
MTKSQNPIERLGQEGPDAIAKVVEHLKAVTAQIKEEAGDTLSASAVALGHATIDLVGEVQSKLDDLASDVGDEIRHHPGKAASLTAAAALVTAAVASLTTYAVMRQRS